MGQGTSVVTEMKAVATVFHSKDTFQVRERDGLVHCPLSVSVIMQTMLDCCGVAMKGSGCIGRVGSQYIIKTWISGENVNIRTLVTSVGLRLESRYPITLDHEPLLCILWIVGRCVHL